MQPTFVQRNGINLPLVVRARGNRYEVVCGLSRWKAAPQLKMRKIPVFVSELSDEQVLALIAEDNMQQI